MPIPRLHIIADVGYVFACITDREPRGGCGYYDADGHYKPLANLAWLRRHSSEVIDLWVSTGRFKSLAMGGGGLGKVDYRKADPFGKVDYRKADGFNFDAILAVRLTHGRVYVTTWQDRTVLRDWFRRPSFEGCVMHWECRTVVVGAPNYEEVCR